MATVLREGELEFDFVGALDAKVFDDEAHGISHGMKRVDFVVEYPEHDLFVEVKDPDCTTAPPERRAEYAAKLMSGTLINSAVGKYRDSWLYRWAEGRERPVQYAVFLQLSSLDPGLLLVLTDRLKRQLPLNGPPTWTRSFVSAAMILDMDKWNALGRFGTVRRVPA